MLATIRKDVWDVLLRHPWWAQRRLKDTPIWIIWEKDPKSTVAMGGCSDVIDNAADNVIDNPVAMDVSLTDSVIKNPVAMDVLASLPIL